MLKFIVFSAALVLFFAQQIISDDYCCVPNPCKNGGECSYKPIPSGYNWNYTCTCLSGFIGEQCQWDNVSCSNDTNTPCQNNGQCIVTQDGRFCECPGSSNVTIKYGGHYCEIVDPCTTCPELTVYCQRMDRLQRGRVCLNIGRMEIFLVDDESA